MSLDAGLQIAQYLLERRLGAGGMGEVYLARDTRLHRLVAIKFLAAPTDSQSRRRLLHEARAIAGLDHPGICAVHEVGTDLPAGDFIVMQYIEGDTLAARLRRGRLPPDESLSLAAQIADALSAAHHRGIVHRDLKPQNIMITPAGVPKLLDFGVATRAPDTAAAANAATTLDVGDPRVLAGTPSYMSPEQVRNATPDVRSDIFALGCVLYECLTGRRAFAGATTAETLGQVLHVDPPPVSAVVSDAGPAYDGLCARLLHKLPRERFQSAEEVLGAIRSLTPSAHLSADSIVPLDVRRRRPVAAIAVATSVVALAVAAYGLWPRGPALPVPPANAAHWYDIGVEAMRDGTYVGAIKAFHEAITLFASYPQAYSRLGEAQTALGDDRGANDSLLRGARLVANRTRLQPDDQLRFDAASAAVEPQHDAAIGAYRKLVDRQPRDAGRWLDLGRAQEAAGRLAEARETYQKAIALDAQSAAAHLRFGVVTVRMAATAAEITSGVSAIDEAIRLYQAATKTEGEAEAMLREAAALVQLGRIGDARRLLEKVLTLSAEYPAQRVGAKFELARADYYDSKIGEAETLSREAVAEATAAGLPTVAANGLVTLAAALIGQGASFYAAADAQCEKAIEIARDRGATRIEMVARLQQASIRVQSDRPDEALKLGAAPLKYFKDSGEALLTTKANNVLSRAHEALEQYEEAGRLVADAIAVAKAARDDLSLGEGLENLAGQLTKRGRLPEALTEREEIVSLHQRMNLQAVLPYDLTNQAELLVLLGRGRDAETRLDEVDAGIAKKIPSYVQRTVRVALLRALLASTEQRWDDVGRFTAAVDAASPTPAPGATGKLSYAQAFARLLAEHARAQTGRSRAALAAIAGWPAEASSPLNRREWTYWSARILLLRGEAGLARQLAADVLAEPEAQRNPELAWRLAAVGALAEKKLAAVPNGASMTPQAKTNLDQITTAWAGAAESYFRRPDLAEIRKSVR